MKNFILFLRFIGLLLVPPAIMAHEKPTMKTGIMAQKGKDVTFTVLSSKYFHFGGNTYVLHIGNKDFTRNRQTKKNGEGVMTFYIPADDFKKLNAGTAIYITYGHTENSDEKELEELSKTNEFPCWYLGKLNKASLIK